jgi:peptidyl-prolyl cis-trans isomerase A (cyclophilin A)
MTRSASNLIALSAALIVAGASVSNASGPPASQPAKPKASMGVDKSMLMDPSKLNEQAPATFKVDFVTSQGNFTVAVTRAWSPNGADRFYNLVKHGFYDDIRFFRVIDNFMAQFGINGDPAVQSHWREATIKDDAPAGANKQSNKRGYITYAKTGAPDSRSTQLFINFKDNSMLDPQGFTPFGQVTAGMDVVDKLYKGYGEGAPRGAGPDQGRLQMEGNAYLNKDFPKLDYIKTARIAK